jgi:hypothetical protein
MEQRRGRRNAPELHVVTGVPASTQTSRRNRYMLLMLFRALLVPGVLLIPAPGAVQAVLVLVAAVSQFVAVVAANEPDRRGYHNPNALDGPLPVERRPAVTAPDPR